MSIISGGFLLFVAAGLFLYYSLFKKCQWLFLLGLSYVFYLSYDPVNIIYLLATSTSIYLASRVIDKTHEKIDALDKKTDRIKIERLGKWKKSALTLALLFNFGMLCIFKYPGVALSILETFLPKSVLAAPLNVAGLASIMQPLGISFYIFQATGYLIDIYRRRFKVEKNPLKVCLFIAYFPQITQGPIGSWGHLKDELFQKRRLNYDALKSGLILLCWGLFKKIVISSRAAMVVNPIFDNYYNYNGPIVLIGVLFYGIQIYTDFSGGIDIVRGVSELFGIGMEENFRQPFFATSLADFWRRWHISLGRWLREYVFLPLNLSKPMGKINHWARRHLGAKSGRILVLSISTFIIYFIVGIWHGGDLKFLAFGIYNGSLISLSQVFEAKSIAFRRRFHLDGSKLYYLFTILRTNFLVIIGRFFTRGAGLYAALSMIKHSLFHLSLSDFNIATFAGLGLGRENYSILLASCVLLLAVDALEENQIHLRQKLKSPPVAIDMALLVVIVGFLLSAVFFSSSYVATEFIYGQY